MARSKARDWTLIVRLLTSAAKDPMTTMAAINRLVHHATILEFDGESGRANKAKARPAT